MLELLSLSIDGFLGYGKTGVIPLNQPGITLIHGQTGSGKSTIFEAVYYLLIGELLSKASLIDDLINKVIKDGFDIVLEYKVDNNYYKIQEIRGRKGKGLFFWENEEPIYGASKPDLRKKILASLKMAPEDVCAIAFMGQNQFHKLVYGKSSERADEIIRIYGLNQYEEALQVCGRDVEDSSKKRKVLVLDIEKATDDLKRIKEQFESEKAVDLSEEKLLTLEKGIVFSQQEIIKVEVALNKIRHAEYAIREAIGRIDALKEKYALLQNIHKEIGTIKNDLAELAESKYSDETLQRGLEFVKTKLANITASIMLNRTRLKSVNDLDEKCPINCKLCPVGVPRQFKRVQEADINARLTTSQTEFDKLNSQVLTFKRLLDTATTRKKLKEKLKDKECTLDSLGVFEVLPDLADKKQKALKYAELIGRGTTKLKSLNSTLTKFKEDKAACIKAREYKEKTQLFIDGKRRYLQGLQEQLIAHDLEHEYLVTALNVLKKAKAYKIDYVINLLNEHIQSNLDQISDGVLQARCSSQRKDSTGKKLLDSIEITVSDSFKEIPFELASGGQQTQVCLAILSAIFETVRTLTNKSISSIWLDEVFGPISSDTLDRVFESLIDLSKRIGVSSIKIISHRELDSRFIDHIWKASMEEGISRLEILC